MSLVKNHIESLGYSCTEVADSIFLIPDFLNDKEIDLIYEQINSSSENDWTGHYMRGIIENAKKWYGRDDIDNLVKEGLVEITSHWVDKNLSLNGEISYPISERVREVLAFDETVNFDGIGTIQRQYEGAQLTEHVDNHTDPGIIYAIILYVNDNYTDGELFFSKLNFEIKPPKKSLLIFPSGEKYWHGVKPPGPGPHRYVLPSFARRSV